MLSSLRIQAATALGMVVLLFLFALSLQVRGFERAINEQSMLTELSALVARVDDVERRGRGYAAVAPRDYESYYRDVAVIYGDWKADLQTLQANIDALATAVESSDSTAVTGGYAELRRQHEAFRLGLAEKLGPDEQEPQLEWGAQFIEANAPALRAAAVQLEEAAKAMVARHLQGMRWTTRLTWLFGGIGLVLLGWWFWRRVISRIGKVAVACRAVAEGAFGERAEVDADDELGVLATAFNQLSSRTRVVLGVLDRLPDGAGAEDAFDLLWQESRDHLGQSWQGLFEFDAKAGEAQLLLQNEREGVNFGEAGNRFAMRGIVDTLDLAQSGSAFWDDIRRHTLDPSQGRLLRELSRRDLRSLALVALAAPGQPQRILAFAWPGETVESGVARFLGGLGRFLGRILVQPPRTAEVAIRAVS